MYGRQGRVLLLPQRRVQDRRRDLRVGPEQAVLGGEGGRGPCVLYGPGEEEVGSNLQGLEGG